MVADRLHGTVAEGVAQDLDQTGEGQGAVDVGG
jgi:hypothetical protein